MAKLEFFFDCSSPWTYLAFSRIEAVCERTGADIHWRPILVGGVFNAVNQDIYEARANPHPVKGVYSNKDLQDWALLRRKNCLAQSIPGTCRGLYARCFRCT